MDVKWTPRVLVVGGHANQVADAVASRGDELKWALRVCVYYVSEDPEKGYHLTIVFGQANRWLVDRSIDRSIDPSIQVRDAR